MTKLAINQDDLNVLRRRSVSESSTSSYHSLNSRPGSNSKVTKKKRKRKSRNVLHFLKDLLDTPNDNVISWEDKESGIFRIHDRDSILQYWNKDKTRPVKCWDNFAKTLRTHYKSQGENHLRYVSSHFVWRFSKEFMTKH